MRRRIWIAALLLVAAAVLVRLIVVAQDFPGVATAARLETLRADPPRLRAFLAPMPKGADLHTHLSGAVYAERLIGFAAADGLCLRTADMTLVPPPPGAAPGAACGPDGGLVPVAEAIAGWRGQGIYDRMVNAFSMRWFVPSGAVPSGHDQFFSTFSRFNAATGGADFELTLARLADMTVDQLRQYDAEKVQYAELMATLFEGEDRRRMAQVVSAAAGDRPVIEVDPAVLLAALKANGLDDLVAGRARQLTALIARIDALRACDGGRTKPGCGVAFRYIAQINRNGAPAEVFAQTALSAALVRAASAIVAGINYVGPEDFQVARRDYRTHMGWVGFLAGTDVPVALHAGELWLGLVPPDDLDFHIRAAVEMAGARRIGHGTAIAFERDMDGLLAEMSRRGVAVEIALTSSHVILGVRGHAHPILTYLAAGVPVVLATDDAGVSRIDLTNEFVRAALEQGVDYARLKAFAHAAIAHAFLPEADKARERERLDAAFAAFEQDVAGTMPLPARVAAVLRAAFGFGAGR
ncbi:adenosine deaminase [Xanthobacter sp. KR7-225]|uniref:adenosine deaminase n=1 Tax=Xanthobacter sp. KR7-225 TaxID=3156613 RepID=UPI0032B3AB31